MHNSYDKLLFFSVSKVLSLHDILTAGFSVDEIIQEVSFLFENNPQTIVKLKTAVKVSLTVIIATYVHIHTYTRIIKILNLKKVP